MNKLSVLLLGATMLAGASFAAATTPASQDSASPTFYYWLHPKLGMVKVDKATNAMVKSKRSGAENVEQRSPKTESPPTPPHGNSVVESSSYGYVSERGEATYSGPAPRNTVQQASDTKSRAMVASSGMPLSRAQVLNELKDFQRNPVTTDGYRFINGEIGYVYVGPKFFQ